MVEQSKSEQILDIAEWIVRSRGFNAFSYADIATEIGVSKASLHHHFATKADLGLQMISRFSRNVINALDEVRRQHTSNLIRLREYARLYEGSLQENKMCLCGMLAAEHETLSQAMQDAINDFFNDHELWLEEILEDGKRKGEFAFEGAALTHAQLILSQLQGGLLVAKSLQSTERISTVVNHLIESYRAKHPGSDAAYIA